MAVRLTGAALRDVGSRAAPPLFSPSSRLLNYRSQSSGSSRKRDGKNAGGLSELIEMEVIEGSDLVGGVKRLEDAIQAIIIRKAAPEWLPLRPGSSYWVPPRRIATATAMSMNLTDLIGKLVNPMTKEESLSLTTSRGWPSYSYYIEDATSHPMETDSKMAAQSDEEEG